MFERIKATLRAYRVEFDVFFNEAALHEGTPSAIERGIERLSEQGHLYRSEGALWLRTTDFGDDKDRVLERSTGAARPTSRPTSPTPRTSSSAASTCSSSRWAPTTTATSRG